MGREEWEGWGGRKNSFIATSEEGGPEAAGGERGWQSRYRT
jgi:hypothetical protein